MNYNRLAHLCSYHIVAINYDIVRGIKRLARDQKQSLEAVIVRFVCSFIHLGIDL